MHIWSFKIDQRNNSMVIGIDASTKNTETTFCDNTNASNYKCTKGEWNTYGGKCNSGDTVKMILNTTTSSLRFEINGKDQGVYFENMICHHQEITKWLELYMEKVIVYQL